MKLCYWNVQLKLFQSLNCIFKIISLSHLDLQDYLGTNQGRHRVGNLNTNCAIRLGWNVCCANIWAFMPIPGDDALYMSRNFRRDANLPSTIRYLESWAILSIIKHPAVKHTALFTNRILVIKILSFTSYYGGTNQLLDDLHTKVDLTSVSLQLTAVSIYWN